MWSARSPLAFGRALGCVLAGLACGPSPAAGDWLVTRQGERIETRGAWQERGKLVVFTHPKGTLVSMRLSDLDLEASRAATREAKTTASGPAQAAPAPERKATIRLTDKDFQHEPEVAEPRKEGEAATAGGEKPRALAIGSWERQRAPGDGHVIVQGVVRNNSNQQVTSAGVSVRLFDTTGELLATQEAQLATTVIPPGGSARFEADFPDIYTFASAKLDTKSVDLGLKTGPPAAIPTKPKLVFQPDKPGPNG